MTIITLNARVVIEGEFLDLKSNLEFVDSKNEFLE